MVKATVSKTVKQNKKVVQLGCTPNILICNAVVEEWQTRKAKDLVDRNVRIGSSPIDRTKISRVA